MKTPTTIEPTTPVEAVPPPDDTPDVALAALAAENAELRSAIQISNARDAIIADLTAAGARSPRLLYDAVKSEISVTPDGVVAGRTEVVERLKAAFPEQFGTAAPPSIDAGAGRTDDTVLTRDALARMSPVEISTLDWQAVKQALAAK